MTLVYVFLIALLLASIPVTVLSIRAYRRYRGARRVICPESETPAAVRVDERHAAVTTALGEPELRLRGCSHWPERERCGQECISQIEAAPRVVARPGKGQALPVSGKLPLA